MAEIAIIGGGHNGLVAAIILQTAGHRVVVLESKERFGGAAAPDNELGFSFNWGANHLFMLFEEVISATGIELDKLDLKSAARECEFIRRLPGMTGAPIETFDSWPTYMGDLRKAASVFRRHLLDSTTTIEKLRTDVRALKLRSGLLFLDGSISELLEFYFGDNEASKAMALAGKVLSFHSPYEPGSAVAVLYLACANDYFGSWSSPRKGMGAVTSALAKIAIGRGCVLTPNAEVVGLQRIGDKIVAARLKDGREVNADYFATTVSLPILLRLLGIENLMEQESSPYRDWSSHMQDGGCSKLLVVATEPLQFKGAKGDALSDTMIVRPLTIEEMHSSYLSALEHGHSRNPYFEVFCEQAFHGKDCDTYLHSIYVMYSCYSILAAMSDERRRACGKQVTDSILADLSNDNVVQEARLMDPVDLESHFLLSRGNVDHGRFLNSCILDRRNALASIESVPNLTNCGPSANGGGLVSGVAGYLGAQAILENIATA